LDPSCGRRVADDGDELDGVAVRHVERQIVPARVRFPPVEPDQHDQQSEAAALGLRPSTLRSRMRKPGISRADGDPRDEHTNGHPLM
jgi:hypothetical protein